MSVQFWAPPPCPPWQAPSPSSGTGWCLPRAHEYSRGTLSTHRGTTVPGGGERPQQRGAERGQRRDPERHGRPRRVPAASHGPRHTSTHTRTRLHAHGSEGRGGAGHGRARTHVATIGSFVFQRYAWTTWNLFIDDPDIDIVQRECSAIADIINIMNIINDLLIFIISYNQYRDVNIHH